MTKDLLNIITTAARMGASEALKAMKPADDRISKSEAEREYGRGFLRDNASRLTVTANGNRLEYSRAELEQVKAAKTVAILAFRIENKLTL